MNMLTLHDVTEVVKVSESTVRRWIKTGALAAYKIGKRGQLRIKKEDLENFLEEQRIERTDLRKHAS